MGNYSSVSEERDAKLRSDQIDKQIEEDSMQFQIPGEHKILLLGCRESGKSTIVKQMKIVHKNGFSLEERLSFRTAIYRNLLESAQALILAMRKLGIDPSNPSNIAGADRIMDFALICASDNSSSSFPEDVAETIKCLWLDPVVSYIIYSHGSEFYLMDNASYFFMEANRIASPNYVPTESDVLRCRQKSTGITETRFSVPPLTIRMFDVSGQNSDRNKWFHCFEGVASIIFCTSLSEYDQVLLEQKDQNRMVESLVLFESVINSPWFLHTSIILFMNKIDIFINKLSKVPLEKYFPEYTGGPDFSKATEYILRRFVRCNRWGLRVYAHFTQATDTANFVNFQFMLAAVKDTILHNALMDSTVLT